MILDVIKNMIYKDSYIFESPHGIRCIDDRDDRQLRDSIDPLPDIAIPGTGLGLILGVFGGLNLMSKENIKHDISRDLVFDCAYKVTGGMPYHSDEKRVNDSNVAAGCGHFALALGHGEKYLLSKADMDFFETMILPKLAEKKAERILYSGSHEAKAVVIIDSPRLGLPSLLSNGDRIYVYSKRQHELLIDEVAYKISEATPEEHIDRNVLRNFIARASDIQLAATLEHLASTLPVFTMTSDEKGDAVVTLNQ